MFYEQVSCQSRIKTIKLMLFSSGCRVNHQVNQAEKIPVEPEPSNISVGIWETSKNIVYFDRT